MSIQRNNALISNVSTPQFSSHFPAIPAPVSVPLTVLPEQPCPYLPDRFTTLRAMQSTRIDPEIYHDFMDAGFRRSGRMVYQNVCRGCRACMSIRVPVERFAPNKSLRRCVRKNADIAVSVGRPRISAEKMDLYQRYLAARHDRQQDDSPDGLESFLYKSPVATIEFEYRAAGKLVAIGICDVGSRSVSSVYFYFDPAEARRGLGNLGVFQELAFAAQHQIPHYYLGFWVSGCDAMSYKARFRPAEVLGTDGVWRELSDPKDERHSSAKK